MTATDRKSKKRSGASFRSKPPEPLVFFLDRSLGKKLVATALREAGVIVHVHDDYFASDARDEIWLREVGRRGWIVLTKDQRIRYRRNEMSALPAMHRTVDRYAAPFLAAVSKGGRVTILS